MEGRIPDEITMMDKARSFGIPYKEDYLLYVFVFEEFSFSHATYLMECLSRLMPNEKALIHKDSLILLKNSKAYSCDDNAKQERFDSLLTIHHASCGLSSSFGELGQVRNA